MNTPVMYLKKIDLLNSTSSVYTSRKTVKMISSNIGV